MPSADPPTFDGAASTRFARRVSDGTRTRDRLDHKQGLTADGMPLVERKFLNRGRFDRNTIPVDTCDLGWIRPQFEKLGPSRKGPSPTRNARHGDQPRDH